LPKNLAVGSDVPDMAMYQTQLDGSAADSELRKGQVLWLRGIARLQTQVNKHFTNFYIITYVLLFHFISIISF